MFGDGSEDECRTTSQISLELSSNGSLLFSASSLGGNGGGRIFLLFLFLVAVTLMFRGWNPEARLPVVKGLVLVGQIDALTGAAGGILAALRERAGASGKLGVDRGVLLDPICEGIFAVLDDSTLSVSCSGMTCHENVRTPC